MRKPKQRKLLPKTSSEITSGGVFRQLIRCGKSNCHCVLEERHVAYYFFTRYAGKLTKIYVPNRELDRVRALCLEASRQRKANRLARREAMSLIRQMRQLLRDGKELSRHLHS